MTYSTTKIHCDDRTPPTLHQWGEEAEHRVIDQETCDRWTADKNSLLRAKKPHEYWVRTCAACDQQDYSKDVEIGGACVWEDEDATAVTP